MKCMYRLFCFLLMVIVLWNVNLTFAGNMSIESIKKKMAGNHVEVEISLSESPHYHAFSLVDPHRLVIDFEHTVPMTSHLPDFKDIPWIKGVRMAEHSLNVERLVFEFTELVASDITVSPPTAKGGLWRLTLDLEPPFSFRQELNQAVDNQAAAKALKTADEHFAKSRCVSIVIDPGHGGHDPGAVSAHGVREKDITLAISESLADLINHTSGMCAYLTRTGDYFVSLRGRIDFARKKSADLFIAIHADIFNNKAARGATVFALSERGATSEAARWIAHNENVDSFLEVGESDAHDKDLQSVLMDISQTETINRSLIFGKDVLLNLDNVSKLHHTIVEQAGFVVLKSPDIPSILVETGFLSNAYEEEQLSQSAYQKKIALAIYRGVMEYSRQYSLSFYSKKEK